VNKFYVDESHDVHICSKILEITNANNYAI
jgi:hypothetical protein